MARASDALLGFLRDMAGKKGLKTAALAERTGLDRGRLRKTIAGAEDMTVDELLLLLQALEVTPADMGLPDAGDETENDGPVAVDELPDEDEDDGLGLDPWGNHPRQLFEAAFELGVDVMILLDADAIADSGVPEAVRKRYAGTEMPIKLDAAYHEHMNPRMDDDGVKIAVGFDALYECRFPWTAFRRMIFFPLPPDEPDAPSEEDEDGDGAPFLRLVE